MATVFDKRLKQEVEALDEAPLSGPLGQEVLAHVGKESWAEWEEMQLKIVNEYHLDLSEKAHRKKLVEQLRIFLCLDDDQAGAALEVGTPTEPGPSPDEPS